MIVRARIHPGVGIARVGDSPDGFTIGPEVPGAPSTESVRDAGGALKRQAARFRVYGIDQAGAVVGELTADTAEITWTVHVANRKAAWYRFLLAMDIPEAVNIEAPLRNRTVTGRDRQSLVIDPGPKSIVGRSRAGDSGVRLDGGSFKSVPVSLGELRTDEQGRLLVLGGRGRSESPSHAPIFRLEDPDSFNNADDWFDDTSDGPVTAEVTIDGHAIPVEGAWVVVAPPNYAPDIIGWRTMADLLADLYVDNGQLPQPSPVRFHADVLPILRRLTNLQWVNAGFAAMFGHGRPMDFDDPALAARLAATPAPGGTDPYRELRHQLINAFRPSQATEYESWSWPWIYGDANNGMRNQTSPRVGLALSKLQAWVLGEWAQGRFEHDEPRPPLAAVEEAPAAEQPDLLDRAALGYCLADAFHPGCELTWPMRHLSVYSSPFRIRHRPADDPERDLGPSLDQNSALGVGGPLYAQPPGGLTRWMGLPWQGDTAMCRSDYEPWYDSYLPTFWPARVPNHVLTEESYRIATDPARPRQERVAAFNSRAVWTRSIDDPEPVPTMQHMVEQFAAMGVVEARPGVRDDPELPEVMYVENIPPHVAETLRAAAEAASVEPGLSLTPSDPLVRAGWLSEERLEAFRRVRFRQS